jgi:hypothetical protein
MSGPSAFYIFFTLETEGIMGERGFSCKEGGKAAEYLENLVIFIVQIDLAQQKFDHSALC